MQLTTLLHIPGIDQNLQQKFESATLRFVSDPVNIEQVASQCDLCITHAGHGVTARMMVAGKPQLLLPFYLEQRLTAEALRRRGAAEIANTTKPTQIVDQLRKLLLLDIYRTKAQALATSCVDSIYVPRQQAATRWLREFAE